MKVFNKVKNWYIKSWNNTPDYETPGIIISIIFLIPFLLIFIILILFTLGIQI